MDEILDYVDQYLREKGFNYLHIDKDKNEIVINYPISIFITINNSNVYLSYAYNIDKDNLYSRIGIQTIREIDITIDEIVGKLLLLIHNIYTDNTE